jgi:hypothetical protein
MATIKRLFGGLLAALVAAAMLAVPNSAYAAAGDLTCTISSTVTYSPGLTLTTATQYVTYSTHYSGCTSTNGATVTSATANGSYYADFSCLSLPSSTDVAATIPWNDSTSSAVEGTGTYANVGGQSIYTTVGTVTSGRFTGDTFVEAITESTLNLLACATTGVTSQTGIGVVTFA